MKRTVLVLAHTGRPAAVRNARLVVDRLTAAGINVRVLAPEATDLQCAGADVVPAIRYRPACRWWPWSAAI